MRRTHTIWLLPGQRLPRVAESLLAEGLYSGRDIAEVISASSAAHQAGCRDRERIMRERGQATLMRLCRDRARIAGRGESCWRWIRTMP